MSLSLLFAASTFLVPAPIAKPEGWTGQIVMLRESAVEYRLDPAGMDNAGNLRMIEYRVARDLGELLVVIENGKEAFVLKRRMVLQTEAAAWYNEFIQLNPTDPAGYAFRGWAFKQRKDNENALNDYNKAIELQPSQCAWWNNRALIWIEKKEFEKAIADYGEAIRLFPQYGLAYRNRGTCLQKQKDYANALKDFEKAIELGAESPYSWNSLARFLAACPDDKFRDGKRSLELATKAFEMTEGKNGWILDTLAAAHAEVGEFDEAIKFQEKAFLDPFYTTDKEKLNEARQRLNGYREKKPFRDVPKEQWADRNVSR